LLAKKLTGVGCERNKRIASAGGVAFIASGEDAELPRQLATQAGRQLRGGGDARGVARAAAVRGSDARGPHRITVAGIIHSLFCKLLPKFELKSKFC